MAFTSQAAVELILSAEGEDDIVSDLTSGDQTSLWTSILREVDSIIYLYTNDYYDPTDLVGNYWLQEKAKWIAAYLISRRRGEPGYYAAMYEEAMLFLQGIRDGKYKIPANDGTMLAQSSANMPAIANMIYDDRSKLLPQQVDTLSSAGELGGAALHPFWNRFWIW